MVLCRAAVARSVRSSVIRLPWNIPSPISPMVSRRWMAGHNKWSKIKHKKGAKDAARSIQLGKASRAIMVASRACQGDLDNLQLQSAIAHAKSVQLPKDRIQDAIDKYLTSSDGGGDLEPVRYDAMMSFHTQKVAFVITALTDNRNRTAGNVRATVTKMGGELLPTNSLRYLFRHVGVVLLEDLGENMIDEDALWNVALDAGATDIDVDDNSVIVTCESSDLWQIVTSLRDGGFNVDQFEHRYVLDDQDNSVSLHEEAMERFEAFVERLEQDEDVTNLYHNAR